MMTRRWFVAFRSTLIVSGVMLALLYVGVVHAASRTLTDYVNALRGSDSSPEFSRGNTFPAVALPFGFNFWTPITESNSSTWLYQYRAQHISGFGVSHEPSPWTQDHGSIQIMPMFGTLRISPDERKTPFRHANETAHAHYYRVALDAEGITVEFSPTNHASKWRFTYEKAGPTYLLFNSIDKVPGTVAIDASARTVQGYVDQNGPRLYFFAHIEKAISSSQVQPGANVTGWVQLNVVANEAVEMSMATSFISVEQARKNLDLEVNNRSFDQIKQSAASEWARVLGKIEVQGATEDQKVTFYSNLYRAFLYPNSMWESVDGKPKHFSPYSNRLADGKIYVNNGFWDTYRAVWPLFSLLSPSKAAEMLEGFVTAFRDGGWVPRWSGPGYLDCMVGSSSDIVFADSYARGVTGFDIRTAYASMLKNALTYSAEPSKGRKGNDRSIFKGYVAVDLVAESTAWTLEDVINDFGIAQIAKALGDTTHYEYFLNRSMRYVTQFSTSAGFFRGKRNNGRWRSPDAEFYPSEWGGEFSEGNAWHYAAAATSDPQGMANLMGGRSRLAEKLDSVFNAPSAFKVGSYGGVIHEMTEAQQTNLGQYAHPNEPIHSMIYMYNYANRPAAAQWRARQVLAQLYESGRGTGRGYLGDEDNGQMSAWYLFSALGFYPASPGHAEYALGSPLFKRAVIHLENGKRFTVSAPENSYKNLFIQSAKLNGVPHTKNYLTHAAIMAGGVLDLTMGPIPSQWGTHANDVPTSITPGSSSRVPHFREDRAVGGKVTASSENLRAHAGKAAAFDDDSLTRWYAPEPAPSIQYSFGSGKRHAVSLYTLTSAADTPEFDPRDWQLQASNDCTHWQTIDQRSNQQFAWRRQTRVFSAENHMPFACYRLKIEANHGGKATQLSEIELIGDAPLVAAIAQESPGCNAESSSLRATDGNLSTHWCSTATTPELIVDLGANSLVNEVTLYHAGAGGEPVTLNTRAYTLELSLDGQQWYRVVEAKNNHESTTQHTFAPTVARFIRLIVTKPNSGADNKARIYELEVYGQAFNRP
jgi:predicted alpha-1,2-mannosidase